MKTKLSAVTTLLTLALLFPGAASGQLVLTGARVLGIGADGKPEGSYWNTVEDGGYNVYFFTGTSRSPKFLNRGNTTASLNPKVQLKPGTYTFNFAGDTKPCPALSLDLFLNDDPQARISVTTSPGVAGQFSGVTTFSTGDSTVTLTEIQTFPSSVDLVGAYETKPNGNPDIGGTFKLLVTSKAPPLATATLRNFKLTGDINGDQASFTLNAIAMVTDRRGGSVELLSGAVALTDLGAHPKWRLKAEQGRYVATFDRNGEFPIQLKFTAAVRQSDNWNSVNFRVASSPLQPIVLKGLAEDTQFQFASGARPDRVGGEFLSYLPSDGVVNLSWKEARPEAEGKLFYAAEMLSQLSVSPGLLRQVALLDLKVMQGEMNGVTLLLRGPGEVTRVQGDQVLGWSVEGLSNSTDRRLVVKLNQPQKDQFSIQLQMQTPLGAFPQTAAAIRVQPENATRFAGFVRIVNEGAVRLEVVEASGMSQVSPDQFPETDGTRTQLRLTGNQRFVYRFSSADFALRLQADQILPELTVSQVLAYHHGESELAIDAEIELDIREAPLRELLLRVPRNYAVARLNAAGMNDYFLRDAADPAEAELRLVYGQPVSGRQVIQLRLERNQSLGETNWILPRIEVAQSKSVRGFVGAASDAGFRLTTERTEALAEIATAFFPGKVAGLQAAFRLNEPAWAATLRVERLPQTMQADVFHLFSIGEGIAYGSSVMNYVVSGAPVSAFRVELSEEYFNVEFIGKDIRNWRKAEGGYLVQLHTPVSGSYTLLATYERPFKAQGETLAFTGARPLDAQSEQGHTLIISAYQFQVKAVNISSGLLPLETGEVPAEYRLFFDAPILAAYRYAARPFDLQLALTPLAQGDSLSQVVDRATLATQISKEGQVLTDVRYFVKSRGNPNFRVTLPEGTELWSATVNGAAVVPVKDDKANLIPLPQLRDPDAVLELRLKIAARSPNPERVVVAAPIVAAPVMLAEWKLEPDAGQRLAYHSGSLTPVNGVSDVSGFASFARLFSGREVGRMLAWLFTALVLVGAALVVWRWTAREGVFKYSARHLGGIALGLVAMVLAIRLFVLMGDLARNESGALLTNVTFLAPVQQAGSELTVKVSNVANRTSISSVVMSLWPAMLAVVVLIYGWLRPEAGTVSRIVGWTLLAWAALRFPHGAPAFIWVITAFLVLQVVIPALRRLWQMPRAPKDLPASSASEAAPAVTALIGCGLIWSLCGVPQVGAADSRAVPAMQPAIAEAVTHEIRIEDKFAVGTAIIRWQAVKGQSLPLLQSPAVMTHLTYPSRSLKLNPAPQNSELPQQLLALENGTFEVAVKYQLQTTKRSADSSCIALPLRSGLINRVNITVANSDVDVYSDQATSVQREGIGSNSVANVILTPADSAWIAWKPRSRDVKREKAVFYVEVSQLYVPSPGVIEGVHSVSIRPAQGELSELVLDVPKGATITDVAENAVARPANAAPAIAKSSLVSLWRFDPDTRKLRVTLNRPQSRPFVLLIRSQVATGTLPFEQSVGLISVENAAGQIGVLGVATGNEVQLDTVSATAFAPINLEDFPDAMATSLKAQVVGLAVRRAFRYSDVNAMASIKASPVEPDVRVETQDTLSLGEDRIVLAVNATVNITRAGVFRLSFVMPAGFDVEAISGAALSHWTEARSETGRVITLHLPGKTEGQQKFTISLAGPGVKATNFWAVPQWVLREANKQRGTLLIVPEQGMRLQVAAREGVTQLDPEKSGIRQKGVLAFRVLQAPANLALDIEQVDPWIQVTSLQHATVTEAQVKVAANLQYQIENTGLKSFHVLIPVDAESVRFQGEQVADFMKVSGAVTNRLQEWEVKLHRRVIGACLLQVNYQILMPAQAAETVLRGVEAINVNLQRGFVTVQSDARLQVSVGDAPPTLQPAEWQSIPRALQQDLPATAANVAYRLVEPSFQLPLRLDRHEAAKLLPARINNITFNSVVSDGGVMLTQVRLEIFPGDKRLLHLTLPKDARFWFAFVNLNGVWPWREMDQILIPLEQQARGGQPVSVELFYSCQTGKADARSLDLELLAPKFDLPLENITWRVSLSEKWQIKNRSGALQFESEVTAGRTTAVDLQTYLRDEATLQQQKTKEAEGFLAVGNLALEQGDPLQARRAFQNAFGLSSHDAAFNEDARVQLHNIKLQQALVGLNVRQAAGNAGPDAPANKLSDRRNRGELNYTQQDAKEIMGRNSADENAAFMRLAERLIQQQDAAVSSPGALRANIPEQGRVLTFKRSVVVDRWADLKINLEAGAKRPASGTVRLLILAGTGLLLAALALSMRFFASLNESSTKV